METRVYLLFLVGIVGVSQFFASTQTRRDLAAQRDALMPQRAAAERSVERTWALEAAGGVDAGAAGREAVRCDSLSFAGRTPVCHTSAPELRVERGEQGELRLSAVRRTSGGTHVVSRGTVRDLAAAELIVETQP